MRGTGPGPRGVVPPSTPARGEIWRSPDGDVFVLGVFSVEGGGTNVIHGTPFEVTQTPLAEFHERFTFLGTWTARQPDGAA